MKILAVQNRMGIADTVIFLPYIQAISKKFNSQVSLLVKESSKADQFLHQTEYIDKIIFLERDKKNNIESPVCHALVDSNTDQAISKHHHKQSHLLIVMWRINRHLKSCIIVWVKNSVRSRVSCNVKS